MPRFSKLAVLCAASSLAALVFARQTPVPAREPPAYYPPQLRAGYTEELFFAVLEGLYRDGVSDAVVAKLSELDPKSGWPRDFVYACNICMPAFDALQLFRTRPKFFGDKQGENDFGEGLPEDLERRLLSLDDAERHGAIRELVQRWVTVRFESKRPTEAERAEWADEMAIRRKAAMQLMEVYRANGLSSPSLTMNTCAFCDAANGACKPPSSR